MRSSSERPAWPGVVVAAAACAAVAGVAAALHYHRLGLTLSHYDARGHLIVARRIADSITPGWQQIGAVWLPLPHLLNALPVQVDAFYRTGASGVAISVLSFAVETGAIAWIVWRLTDSGAAAIAGALVFAANPNVLYLQATPMTEPLLMALTTTAVATLIAELPPVVPGVLFALACLTRYEAWPVTGAALALAALARWWTDRRAAVVSGFSRTSPLLDSLHAVAPIALYPAVAIAGFIVFSRVVVGEWFVASGFFVPENKAMGDAVAVVKEIAWGASALSSELLVWHGAIGLLAGAAIALSVRGRARGLVVVALLATAAIPLAAFYRGHPFRIRYMVPLIPVEAVGAGLLAGLNRRFALASSVYVGLIAVLTLRPVDPKAPMVVEAQWDRPNAPVRARVTECLGAPVPGTKIMASMGSLGHYMQEASSAGFALSDFLHEGNGDIWLAAIERPRPFADWVLIEEKAEGGDMLAKIAREDPHFLDGYVRRCEGAGLALYQRQ